MNPEPRLEEIPPWNMKEHATDPLRMGLTPESHGEKKGGQEVKGAPLFLKSGLSDQSHRPILEGDGFEESHLTL